MKNRVVSQVRLLVQSASLLVFVYCFFALAYPVGREASWLIWLSRLDPWLLVGQGRLAATWPEWWWLPFGVAVVTLLLGRVFCGWLCPLGALLTWTDTLSRRLLPERLLRRQQTLQKFLPLRYYWLLFLVLSFFLGANWVLFLTPYALLSHELMLLGEKNIPWVLGIILVATVLFARLWCSVLCPSGVLFSLLSQGKQLRYQVSGACSHCGACARACSVGASPEKTGNAGDGCMACGECQKVCPLQSIQWGGAAKNSSAETGKQMQTGSQSSRRRFFTTTAVVAVAILCWKQTATAMKRVLRPPGALAEPDFSAACNRCGRCIQVCPGKALAPMPVEEGLGSFATPFLTPRKARCDLCLACQEVCPTGAIAAVPLEKVQMGQAVIDKPRCLAWSENKLCFICGEQCPVLAIVDDGGHRPKVLAEKCVGCGSCENACPVDGEAAIRVTPR